VAPAPRSRGRRKTRPEVAEDEATIEFLGDIDAVARFLTGLLERHDTHRRWSVSSRSPSPFPQWPVERDFKESLLSVKMRS